MGGGIFYGWVIVACTSLAAMVPWGFYYSLGVFFTDLQNAFGANREAIALISSICIGAIYLTGIPYGWAVDRYGSRPPMIIGGILATGGLLLSSRATEVWQLHVCLGLFVGVGTGATVVPSLSALGRWFVKMRGLAIGIQLGAVGVGMMIMAPLSQWLLSNYGWRNAFAILSVTIAVAFGICAWLIRGKPADMGLVPYGVKEGDPLGASAVRAASLDATEPMKKVLESRNLWLLLSIRVLIALAIFLMNLHLVNYAKDAGMSAINAAWLMSIVGAASIAGKVTSGHLADSVGARIIIMVSTGIMAVQMLWLAGPWGAVLLPLSAAIYGLVYGSTFSNLNVMVAEAFEPALMGRALGVVNIGTAVGSLIGPWLGGYVFDSTGSYSVAFLLAGSAALLAALLAVQLSRKRNWA